jgi:hypothetical protein
MAQSVQASDSAPLYWPAPQLPHAVLVALCLPAGHDLQKPCPTESWNFPPGHSAHAGPTAPMPLSYLPAAQSVQEAWPVPGWCRPAAQPTHAVAPTDPAVGTYLPPGHALQSDALA